ncbi:MAG: type II toxin-antitoxin system HicA family toxin [Bacteroidales bacterium]|nr:type II toxin-antitoxin system HicA family toxin [Bacteroidales bacterium]
MKISELKAMLAKRGCQLLRYGSNHDIWYSPATDRQFPVPRHNSKEVSPSTLSRILKDSGIK